MKTRTLWLLSLSLYLAGGCGDSVEPVGRLEITGEVTSVTTGEPIEGAGIALVWWTPTGTGSRSATTDADGRYVLVYDPEAEIASCDGMEIYAGADGYETSDDPGVTCTENRQTRDFELMPVTP